MSSFLAFLNVLGIILKEADLRRNYHGDEVVVDLLFLNKYLNTTYKSIRNLEKDTNRPIIPLPGK
eukprot:UN19795